LRFPTLLLDGLDRLFAAVRIDVGDNDFRPFPGKQPCGGLPNTRAATGDQGDFAVEPVWNARPL